MSLSIMSRTLRALGNGFKKQAGEVAVFEAHSDLLILMGDAALEAADQLDEESRSEAMAFAKAHECTVDHVKMTTPVCPCCHVRKRG